MPVRSFAVTPPVQSDNFKILRPSDCGLAASALYHPFPRQSPKENKLKLRLKIYVLQCKLYAHMNEQLRFKKLSHRCFKTILNSAWLSQHLHCRLPSERDGPAILIYCCVTCRKILDLKK